MAVSAQGPMASRNNGLWISRNVPMPTETSRNSAFFQGPNTTYESIVNDRFANQKSVQVYFYYIHLSLK